MINFRFHLVSLVAVFLAVGLGILVGSTVVDQKIVNRLDSEIRSVRKDNSARKDANRALTATNSQQQAFIDLAAPFVVDARLDNQSVALVAERGIANGVLKDTETLLRDAGADVPAVIWLDDSWKDDNAKRTPDLQAALNLSGNSVTTRDRALQVLARRLAKVPASGRTTTATTVRSSSSTTRSTPAQRVDPLTALEDAGFLSVTDGDSSELAAFPAHVAHVLVVTGDDSHFVGSDLTAAFARALVRADVPTVVAAAYDSGSDEATAPERGASLASIVDDQALTKTVSTIDDLELTQGRVGSVLALEVVGNGDNGHYGYGPEATTPLPPHPS